MNGGTQLEADPQPSVLMKPGVRALNDPAVDAEPAAVSFPTACDHRLDASEFQSDSMGLRVVGAVRVQAYGTKAGVADAALDRGDLVNERHELGYVVRVGGGQGDGQGDPAAVGENVVLASRTCSIRRVWPAFFPPRRLLGSRTSRRLTGTSRACRPPGVSRAARCAAFPTRQPLASRGADASRSRRSRNPSPWAGTPTGCRCAGRTRSPSGSGHRRQACALGTGNGACAGAAAVQSFARVRRPEAVRPRRSPSRYWGSTESFGRIVPSSL